MNGEPIQDKSKFMHASWESHDSLLPPRFIFYLKQNDQANLFFDLMLKFGLSSVEIVVFQKRRIWAVC